MEGKMKKEREAEFLSNAKGLITSEVTRRINKATSMAELQETIKELGTNEKYWVDAIVLTKWATDFEVTIY